MNLKGLLSVLAAALMTAGTVSWAGNDQCAICHEAEVKDAAGSMHGALDCAGCHEGAQAHLDDVTVHPKVRFDLELCGGCHSDQYGTYTYGDSRKTRYGGSAEKQPKTDDFANYNDIVDGHGFTREYNEERSHNVMLKDHFDIKRGKFETCLQCKSTKLAYYWNTGRELTLNNETVVKAGHMKDGITVPKGTKVTFRTAMDAPYPNTHEAQVLVTLPDGMKYSSYNTPDAVKDPAWTWAALYAVTVDGLDKDSPTRLSGNGCNHCHDPHKVGRDKTGQLTGFRIIRKEEIRAIAERGLNPYNDKSEKSFSEDKPLNVDTATALCGQCHVEYVCGVSGVDKIDRDFFPWAKAKDLEASNKAHFPGYGPYTTAKHVQDWTHGTGPLSSPNSPGNHITYKDPATIGEVLTKSQHPETETYWNSAHYTYGAKCNDCHMPKVTKQDGARFTSHWLASPYKYADPEAAGAFAAKFSVKLDTDKAIAPCADCHEGADMKERIIKAQKVQDDIYAKALKVQAALVASLKAIKSAKDAKAAGKVVDTGMIKDAVEDHREAHVRWENLVVSENSMGFHNPTEVNTELDNALKYAASAKEKAEGAVKPTAK